MTLKIKPHRSRVVLLSGNTHRPSKSRSLARFLGTRLAAAANVDLVQYDLVDAGPGLGAAFVRKQLTREALTVLDAIEGADALVVATPVYKGAYPGLFKHLIDLVEPQALAGKPVLIAATGGGHRHALVVEHQLRPLFGFFSALVSPTTVYASDAEFTDGEPADHILLGRIDQSVSQFVSLLGAQAADRERRGTEHGPVDLRLAASDSLPSATLSVHTTST